MRTTRPLSGGASADPRSAAPAQRGPHNENYDQPVYAPVERPVYKSTPGNPLVGPSGVHQGPAAQRAPFLLDRALTLPY